MSNQFTSIEKFNITGRGELSLVQTYYECKDFTHLIGQEVLLDGVKRTVTAVESNCMGWFPVGSKIGLLLKPLPTPKDHEGKECAP